MGLERGRICIKTTGRQAGERVVVLELAKDGFAVVAGARVKKRRCSIRHLFVTPQKVEIKKDADAKEIRRVLEHRK